MHPHLGRLIVGVLPEGDGVVVEEAPAAVPGPEARDVLEHGEEAPVLRPDGEVRPGLEVDAPGDRRGVVGGGRLREGEARPPREVPQGEDGVAPELELGAPDGSGPTQRLHSLRRHQPPSVPLRALLRGHSQFVLVKNSVEIQEKL